MSVSFSKRNLDDAGSDDGSGEHAGFVSGVGGDVASLRRSEGYDGEVKGGDGTGENLDVIRVEAFELREGVDQVVGKVAGIASTLGDDGGNGVARGLAGAEGILVGVDHDPIPGSGSAGSGGQHGLGDHVVAGGSSCQLQE